MIDNLRELLQAHRIPIRRGTGAIVLLVAMLIALPAHSLVFQASGSGSDGLSEGAAGGPALALAVPTNGSATAAPGALPGATSAAAALAGLGSNGSNAAGVLPASRNKATYPGVSPTTVKVGWAWQTAGCGGTDTSAILQAVGINTDWGAQATQIAQLINTDPAQFLELGPAQAAALKAYGPGIWGRKLDLKVYNDYGSSCQDQGRAMAVSAVEQDNIFAMVQNGTEGTEQYIDQEITSRGRIHIGASDEPQDFFQQTPGLSWDGRWGQADVAVRASASYACKDLAGGKANNTGDPTVSGMPRKFGLIHIDQPTYNAIADQMKAVLASCGISVLEIKQAPDLATSQSQAPQSIARFRAAGVTTIFDNIDWLNMVSISQAATKAGYFPEWIVSSHFQDDWPSRIKYFFDTKQAPNIWGTSLLYSNHEPDISTTFHYKMWQLANPGQSKEQTDWQQTIAQMRLLAWGMYGAGPNLTAQSFAQGLEAIVGPLYRSDPELPLHLMTSSFHSYVADFAIIHWNTTKIDPSDGDTTPGYWDFLDNGQRYLGDAYHPSTYVSPKGTPPVDGR